MSDSYQAIYDAVRSRISNGDVGSAVTEAARNAFDISWVVSFLQSDISMAVARILEAATRPSVLYRPDLGKDGNLWSALYGPNIQEGVAAWGETPEAAMAAFDEAWRKKIGQ